MIPIVPQLPTQFAPQPFFVAFITDATDHPNYQFAEAWLEPGDTGLTVKAGGRFGAADNPGVSVTGAAFSEDDTVLVRPADGAGGIGWELYPQTGGGGSPAWGLSFGMADPSPPWQWFVEGKDLSHTAWTLVARSTAAPTAGTYFATYTLSTCVQGDAGVFIASALSVYTAEGVGILGQPGVVSSNCLQGPVTFSAGTLVAADSVSSSYIWADVPEGATFRLYAKVIRPPGRTHTSAKAYQGTGDLGISDGHLVADLTMYTGVVFHKLGADPGGSAPVPPAPVEAGSIIGVATLDGSPLSGRTVTLSGATGGTTTTAADGHFSFDPVNAGANTATLSLSGGETCEYQRDGDVTFNPGNAAPLTVFPATTHSVKFQVTSGDVELSGTVGTGVDAPLAGRVVTLSGANTGSATTDGSGNYSFTGLTAGSTTMTLTLSGLETATNNFDGGGWGGSNARTETLSGSHDLDFRVTDGAIPP
jgi:hypothetical protein